VDLRHHLVDRAVREALQPAGSPPSPEGGEWVGGGVGGGWEGGGRGVWEGGEEGG
jgi:hypothetical protein